MNDFPTRHGDQDASEGTFPDGWLAYLRDNVILYRLLSEAEQARLRELVLRFIAGKFWEGCAGLRVTDEMKVTVAGQACLLLLGWDDYCFEELKTILLYPDEYLGVIPDELGTEDQLQPRLGEAHWQGPVVLSWRTVLRDGRRLGNRNVVLHEFAHKLAELGDSTLGMPPVEDAEQAERWKEVLRAEFNRLRREVAEERPTLLRSYAAVNRMEFFAVATECFFLQPSALRERHGVLYDLLADWYRQDPAARPAGFRFVCVAVSVALAARSVCTAAEKDAEKIDRLIRQLGSEKFAEREAAGRALSAIGTPALSALRKAASTSEDPEVRLRAGRLVAEVMRRSRPAALDCTGEKGVSPADVRRAQQAWAKHLGRNVEETIEIVGGVKMTFVLIPPGKFPMGFPENEKYREVDETLHEVMLTEPFDLAKTEVTQAQYQALGLDNPSHFKGDHFPVEQVSWKEAQHWAEQLTKKQADKHLFRLTTEAEWEYACRGGRPSSLCYGIGDGRVLSSREANVDGNHPYAGAAKGKYLAGTCAVASHPAKAFGLYDMVGNVWEWCADWYGWYPGGSETDPTGPSEGSQRVVRGGGWSGGVGGEGGCRASYRRGYNPSFRDNDLGFRLARSVASDVQ